MRRIEFLLPLVTVFATVEWIESGLTDPFYLIGCLILALIAAPSARVNSRYRDTVRRDEAHRPWGIGGNP